MKMKQIQNVLNGSKGNKIAINYEELKNYMGYEDIFYEDYLVPFLEKNGFTHEFRGSNIILSKKKEVI